MAFAKGSCNHSWTFLFYYLLHRVSELPNQEEIAKYMDFNVTVDSYPISGKRRPASQAFLEGTEISLLKNIIFELIFP